MSQSELLSKFGAISFQEYFSEGISHPAFYGDLVYTLRGEGGQMRGSVPEMRIWFISNLIRFKKKMVYTS